MLFRSCLHVSVKYMLSHEFEGNMTNIFLVFYILILPSPRLNVITCLSLDQKLSLHCTTFFMLDKITFCFLMKSMNRNISIVNRVIRLPVFKRKTFQAEYKTMKCTFYAFVFEKQNVSNQMFNTRVFFFTLTKYIQSDFSILTYRSIMKSLQIY